MVSHRFCELPYLCLMRFLTMMRLSILGFFVGFNTVFAQFYEGQKPFLDNKKPSIGNSYRSPTNKNYWKYHNATSDYWQQDVYYNINASLDDSAEVLYGNESLTYFNNSPNAITEVYFHLYQNSVQPGSLTDELYKNNKIPVSFGHYEAQKKGTEITYFAIQNPGVETPTVLNNYTTLAKFLQLDSSKTAEAGFIASGQKSLGNTYLYTINNTIMRVFLPEILKPGDSITFIIRFKTYFDRGTIRRRMKVYDHHGYKHFNGVHWYPRIAVYDRKFTWETAQHLEKEFYGDFGSFDIQLNLPEQYIVEATGLLVNPSDAMPSELRRKLDLSNFKNTPLNTQPSVVIPPSSNRKIWQYHANNVHDFAFTADPSYRIGEVEWNGIKCIALAQENNASAWQQTAQFTANVIATYSRDFGLYEYPKIVCADAADGMEYPMITLDGGTYPGHQALIAHEVGHNWFFGMIGSNETYRAALDEGFTQFLTAWSMRKLSREKQPELRRAFMGYMDDAIEGKDEILETHSDDFHSATGHGGGYRHVYYKTATMLYNLQYYLGDSLFLQCMRNYVSQWKFRHPYIDDFRNSITQSAQTDLTTFFDQWFNTKKSADYGIKSVRMIGPNAKSLNPIQKCIQGKKTLDNPGFYRISIHRKGEMIMPVDLEFLVETKQTDVDQKGILRKKMILYPVTIPVSYFQKQGRLNLDPWIGWGSMRKTYTFDIQMPMKGKLKQLWLDRSGRLADINRIDNVWKHRNEISLDMGNGSNTSYLGVYQWKWRPDLRYNGTNGLLLGGLISGQYAGRKRQLELGAWYAPNKSHHGFLRGQQLKPNEDAVQRMHYRMSFNHKTIGGGDYFARSLFYNGISLNEAGWRMRFGTTEFGMSGKATKRSSQLLNRNSTPFVPFTTDAYLPQTQAFPGYIGTNTRWSEQSNINLLLYIEHNYAGWSHSGSTRIDLRMPSPWSQSQFGFVKMQWNHSQALGKTRLKIRAFAFLGSGKNPSPESILYLDGANPEESFDLAIARDYGMIDYQRKSHISIPEAFGKPQYIMVNGGLNLRGYSQYSAPHSVKKANGDDTVLAFFRGNQGASINATWDLSGLFTWVPNLSIIALKPYLFADAGIIGQPFGQTNTNGKTTLTSVYSGLMADAGFGTSLTIRNWGQLTKSKALNAAKPITLKFDFPLWLNAVQPGDKYMQLRFRISIDQAF